MQEFLQTVYDAGDIELGTYEGLYCVACEAYYTEDELVDGLCPIHGRPVERVTEENYFFKLSRFERPPARALRQRIPRRCSPRRGATRCSGFISQGLRDFSMSRTSITWGIPLPWDPKHVAYVWSDALFNYCTAVGYGTDPERFERYWPADYHLVGKDILRFHAVYWPAMLMSAGLEPPKCVFAHGWLLVGGEKMSKTSLNQIAPADLVARLRRRRLPLPLPRRPALRSRRRLLLRGDGRPLQRRPREQLRQPRQPRAQHGGELLRRRRARDARERPAARRGGDRVRPACRRDGRGSTSRRRSARSGT